MPQTFRYQIYKLYSIFIFLKSSQFFVFHLIKTFPDSTCCGGYAVCGTIRRMERLTQHCRIWASYTCHRNCSYRDSSPRCFLCFPALQCLLQILVKEKPMMTSDFLKFRIVTLIKLGAIWELFVGIGAFCHGN